MAGNDIEIECKFLLKKVPDVVKEKSTQIEQGYLSQSQDVEFRFETGGPTGIEFIVSQCWVKKEKGKKFKEVERSSEVRVAVETSFVKKVRDLMRAQGQDVVVRVRSEKELESTENSTGRGVKEFDGSEGCGYLTVKGRSDGFGCPEIEIKIDIQCAQEILAMMGDADKLSKKRHYVKSAEREWTIDEFGGMLSGLVLAEIEFEFEEEAKLMSSGEVKLPNWGIMVNVTKDRMFKNVNLIGKKMEEMEGYVKELLSNAAKAFELKSDEDREGNACGGFKEKELKEDGLRVEGHLSKAIKLSAR